MKRVRIGGTDIEVFPIGIGTMPWSDGTFWGYGDRIGADTAIEAFDAAVERGVDLFDTAEVYGMGKSERNIGEILRRRPDAHVKIATKYAPLPWRFSPKALNKALKRSLGRLGLDFVDLYQVHFPGGRLSIDALMNAMADAVEEGLIKAVGVSNYSTDQTRRAHEVLAKRGVPLASNQIEYSLVHRSPEADGLLEACGELGITLIAYSPLGRGLLSGKYRPGTVPADLRKRYPMFAEENLKRALPLIEALEEIGAAHGKAASQAAINWIVRRSNVIAIPGAKNREQAARNADAASFELTDDEAARIDEVSLPYKRGVKFGFRS